MYRSAIKSEKLRHAEFSNDGIAESSDAERKSIRIASRQILKSQRLGIAPVMEMSVGIGELNDSDVLESRRIETENNEIDYSGLRL